MLLAAGSSVKPQRLLSSSVIGALDQALLSAFNLALGVAFIKLATKTAYADYALMATSLLLVQSLQNALVNSPLATLLPAAAEPQREAVQLAGLFAQGWLSVAIILMGGLLASVALLANRLDVLPLIAATALAGLGVLSREFVRSQCFLRHDALAAFRSDLLYVLLGALGVAALAWLGLLSAAPVLALIGTSGLLSGLLLRNSASWQLRVPPQGQRAGLHALWACARWALPSVVNTWLYANAFLYMVEHLISKDAVADLSASRLLLVPMSLLVVGWSSAFRPRASRWFALGQIQQIDRTAKLSVLAFIGIGLLYGAILYALMPFIQKGLLGEKYRGAGSLVALWLIFFTVTSTRTVGMSAMLASSTAFKIMYRYSWMALAVALPATYAACFAQKKTGVILAIIFAELVLVTIIWSRGWPLIRRSGELLTADKK